MSEETWQNTSSQKTSSEYEEAQPHISDSDATKSQILRASLQFVPEHGWSKEALSMGAETEGLPTIAHGMFPRGGIELVHFFYNDCNQTLKCNMVEELQQVDAGEKTKRKVNVFVKDSVTTRLKMITPHINTWPQALGLMALPQNVTESLTLLCTLIDDIWFYAGDRSTDMNWYTKRATLTAVYKSTELHMLQDSSENFQDTWQFLDRRLKNLSEFGQTKKKVEDMGTGWEEFLSGAMTTGRNMIGMNDRNR